MKKLPIISLLIVTGVLIVSCGEMPEEKNAAKAPAAGVEKATSKTTSTQSTEVPAIGDYKANVVPEGMTVQEKKARFRALLVPAVQKVYAQLKAQHAEIESVLKSGSDPEKIAALKKEYRAETDEELLAALKPHPVSIVLAQAAMESAWGTSRFFIKANNLFGVWSFDSNEPRIAAGEQRGDKTIWLKKYASIEDSVKDNYRVLGRSNAFKEFRKLRMTSDNPYELVKKLDKYSEKGHEYGEELASMISFNKFAEYDETFHKRKK